MCPSHQCVARITHETPVPQPDTSKCFTRVHRVNALPSRGETALHPCPPRPGGAAPARRCARPPCGPEPFGSEPFSDPARPLAGPRVPSPPSQRTQDGDAPAEDPRGGGCVGGVARGQMSWDAERRGRSDVCPGNLENFGGRSDQDAALGGTEGLVRDGGARRGRRGGDPVVRGSGSGTSPGEKRRAARIWKEGWTLVRGGDRRGWAGAACGRFGRVTLGAGGGRAHAEFCWDAEKGGLGTGTCGWAQVTETVRDSRMVWGESDGAGDGTRGRALVQI